MGNDLLGGLGNFGGLSGALGGIVGGLAKSGLVPTDTPEGKLFQAQNDLSDLQKQESELLIEIGRKAYEQNPSAWPQDSKLKLIRENLAITQATLNEAKTAQEQAESAKAEAEAQTRCPNCGMQNPEGVKFCQDCGSPLGAAGVKHCTTCGAELAPGTRFCGGCGARQE
jgi:hypothetical protein